VHILQILSMAAIAGGIIVFTYGLKLSTSGASKALAEIADDIVDFSSDPGVPFGKRVLGPARNTLGRLGRWFTPTSQMDKMRRNATLAGIGSGGIEGILATKAIGTLVGAIVVPLAMAALGVKFGGVVWFALIGGAFGFLLPGIWVSRTGRLRQAAIRTELPETIDLMAISVQAGMGLEAAIELASQSLPGPLGDELHRLLQEIQLGSSRREALHQLRNRTEVSELSSFALALIQADAIGSPIADVLQSNSARMRLIRRQVAREKAAKLPVKLLIPMMLFIFPALLIVIIGPAGLSIMEGLGGI
jgi:tight adherence protein C